MNLFNAILIGCKDIWGHKLRTFLTMLGIILGVASLVGMSALVKGMENGLKESMIAMGGADKVLVRDQHVPPYQEHLADQAPGRTMADVLALRHNAPSSVGLPGNGGVRAPSSPAAINPCALRMRRRLAGCARDESAYPRAWPVLHRSGRGTGQQRVRDWHRHPGRPLWVSRKDRPGDHSHRRNRSYQWPGLHHRRDVHPLRERTGTARAGVAPATGPTGAQAGPARSRGWGRGGNWAFWRKNYTVYIPLNTAWVKFRSATGQDNIPDPRLTDIDLKVADLELLEPALQQARNILLMTHRGIEDFTFGTQENQIESITEQIRNTRLSGGFIALISLIVGGIGIMNIMLASINERVREIGICKAVGATGPAIFTQILVESIGVALFGAVFGLVFSFGFVELLAQGPRWRTPRSSPRRPWRWPQSSAGPWGWPPGSGRPSRPPPSIPSRPSVTNRKKFQPVGYRGQFRPVSL
jgi:putative ABC transport system permease protein